MVPNPLLPSISFHCIYTSEYISYNDSCSMQHHHQQNSDTLRRRFSPVDRHQPCRMQMLPFGSRARYVCLRSVQIQTSLSTDWPNLIPLAVYPLNTCNVETKLDKKLLNLPYKFSKVFTERNDVYGVECCLFID